MDSRGIRELRVTLDLSQERFAQHLGVSLQTVRRWESGLAKPLPIIGVRLEELRRQAGAAGPAGVGGAAGAGEPAASVGPGVASGRAPPGGIAFGMAGLFKGIGGLLDFVSRLAEASPAASHTGEAAAAGEQVKAVYGFSLKVGLGGAPVVEPFGNVRETDAGVVVSATREPLIDVLAEGDHFLVVAELPGVEEQDIRLDVRGEDILEITATGRNRRYAKEVLLPAAVDAESRRSTYHNGVLEVRLTKR